MRLISVVLILFFSQYCFTQNLTGIVNNYYAVNALNVNSATLTVSSSMGIQTGDTLLLIQMAGAELNENNSSSYGEVVDYQGAGNHELVEVCDIVGNDVILKCALEKEYTLGKLQLISAPVSGSVNLTATITCQPWNGSTGGVVYLRTANSIVMNADINVSELGFRGGTHFYATNSCNVLSSHEDYSYSATSSLGAMKGEGIGTVTDNYGRGPRANGGGGGNDHNSGGAGGGNVVKGGAGGENEDPGPFRCNGFYPGLGGLALNNNDNQIFMGGGGGAGHSNSSPNPYNAGNGGGIVILMTDELITNGFSILANGENGEDGIGDGGAGGGAGGSVILNVNSFNGGLTIEAQGGDGGNGDGAMSVTNQNTDRCFGPGGGGSGGVTWFKSTTQPSNVTINLAGGNHGVVSGSSHTPCLGLSMDAEDGQAGNIAFDYSILLGNKINNNCDNNPELNIGADTTICEGASVTFTANLSGSYNWNTGSQNSTITVFDEGEYSLILTSGYYVYCDTAQVSIIEGVQLNFNDSEVLCGGDSLTLSAPVANSYLWSNGATSQSITVYDEGLYNLTVDVNGCVSSDSVNVILETLDYPFDGGEVQFCNYDGVDLDAKNSGSDYLWNTGEQNRVIKAEDLRLYFVTITSNNNCEITDSVEVINCKNEIGIPNTITPNGDGENDYWIIRDIYGYPNNRIMIFNRVGGKVYEAVNYDNNWKGDNLPAGVYYYYVDLNNDMPVLKGTITILRE